MPIYELKYVDKNKETAVLKKIDGRKFGGDLYRVEHGLKNRLETAAIKGEQVKSEDPELSDMIRDAFERMQKKGLAKR